jgi:hypothetical protein
MTLKEYALAYLNDLKWSVIPLKPKDKTPLIKWTTYQTRLPTPDEVEKWWDKWPDANIGICCGKVSGIVAIDIDAQEAQEFYRAEYGEIHNTIRQTTGKPGGLHLIFAYPGDGKPYRNIGDVSNTKSETIEIHARGDGGYFVACPSIHPNGTQYQWILDPTESPDDIMDLPKEVKTLWGYGPSKKKTDKKEKDKNKVFDVARYSEGADDPHFPGAGSEGRVIGRDDACTRYIGHLLNFHDPEAVKNIMYGWAKLCRPVFPEIDVDKCFDSLMKKHGTSELGQALGGSLINRIDILQYPDGTCKYQVFFEGFEGYSELTPEELSSQSKFIPKYLAITRVLRTPMKPKVWGELVTNALKEANVIQVDAEETHIGAIMSIINNEIREDRKCTDISLVDTHVISQNGSAFFSFQHILSSLQFSNTKISNNQLSSLLRRMGCKKIKYNSENNQKRFWELKIFRTDRTDTDRQN